MTDQSPDPTETFRRDQEEARTLEQTRDDEQWGLHVAAAQGDVATKMGYAAHLQAKAAFWTALANLLSLVWGAAVATGLIVLGYVIIGWFR